MTDQIKEDQQKTTEPAPPAATVKNGRYDVVTHRMVVGGLTLAVLCTGLNITILQALGREPSPALTNLCAIAIGALAGTLASIMRPH